jgi:hypothetical protein
LHKNIPWSVTSVKVRDGIKQERDLLGKEPGRFKRAKKILLDLLKQDGVTTMTLRSPLLSDSSFSFMAGFASDGPLESSGTKTKTKSKSKTKSKTKTTAAHFSEDCFRWAARGALAIELPLVSEISSMSNPNTQCPGFGPFWMPLREIVEHGWEPLVAHFMTLDPTVLHLLLLLRYGPRPHQVVTHMGVLPLHSATLLWLRVPEFSRSLLLFGPRKTMMQGYVESLPVKLIRTVVEKLAAVTDPRIKHLLEKQRLQLVVSTLADLFVPPSFFTEQKDPETLKNLKTLRDGFSKIPSVLPGILMFMLGVDPSLSFVAEAVDDFYELVVQACGGASVHWKMWVSAVQEPWCVIQMRRDVLWAFDRYHRLHEKMQRLIALEKKP